MKRLCLLVAAATIVAAPAWAADDTITIGFTASRTGPLNVDSRVKSAAPSADGAEKKVAKIAKINSKDAM